MVLREFQDGGRLKLESKQSVGNWNGDLSTGPGGLLAADSKLALLKY